MRNAAESRPARFVLRLSTLAIVCGVTCLTLPSGAFALSELQAPPASPDDRQQDEPNEMEPSAPGLPLPDPLIDRSTRENLPSAEGDEVNPGGAAAAPVAGEIVRDMKLLPEPVQRMRELLVEAAASGDIERLRMLMNPGPDQTVVSGENDDPVEALKSFSGDPEGLEILAILLDILSTAAVRVDAGTPEEVYVWPYFAGTPLASLTPPERVELLRIITAGDLYAMEENGNYNFYRAGITPDGRWKFFSGGD